MKLLVRPALFIGLAWLAFGLPAMAADPVHPASIQQEKELIIRDLYPVEISAEACPDNPRGRFTLQYLLAGLSRDGTAKTALLEWLNGWVSLQDGRQWEIGRRLIAQWKEQQGVAGISDADWRPDFVHAPFRLLAIVNRLDLQRRDESRRPLNAGEGRFVFGVTNPAGKGVRATVIFEYELVATTEVQVREWADRWHGLGGFARFDEDYSAALAALTERFTGRGVAPGRTNGSAFRQLRTNERDLSESFVQTQARWNLREFTLEKESGAIVPTTTKQTPRTELAKSLLMTQFVNEREREIVQSTYTIPAVYRGEWLVGWQATIPDEGQKTWLPAGSAPDLELHNEDALKKLARNTCNGCHGKETDSSNHHIFNRNVSQMAGLSLFLKDPQSKEMAERRRIMAAVLNGEIPDPRTLSLAASLPEKFLEIAFPPMPGIRPHDHSEDELLSLLAGRAHREH
jgi:hypothetical protein